MTKQRGHYFNQVCDMVKQCVNKENTFQLFFCEIFLLRSYLMGSPVIGKTLQFPSIEYGERMLNLKELRLTLQEGSYSWVRELTVANDLGKFYSTTTTKVLSDKLVCVHNDQHWLSDITNFHLKTKHKRQKTLSHI